MEATRYRNTMITNNNLNSIYLNAESQRLNLNKMSRESIKRKQQHSSCHGPNRADSKQLQDIKGKKGHPRSRFRRSRTNIHQK